MIYKCENCNKNLRFELGDIDNPNFAKCPYCKSDLIYISDSSENENIDISDYEEVVL